MVTNITGTIAVKRRPVGGAAGAPSVLRSGEMANNEADNTLYIGIGDDGGGNATSIIAIAGGGTFATKSFVADAMGFSTISYVIDGGGEAITPGLKGYLEIPFACVIDRWTLLADQAGNIVVDVWKDSYGNAPPLANDVITASAKPTISAAIKGQSSVLTGWTTSIAAGDVLAFNVNSASTIQRVTISLRVWKVG